MTFKISVEKQETYCFACGHKCHGQVRLNMALHSWTFCPECWKDIRSFMYTLPELGGELNLGVEDTKEQEDNKCKG